ncbi:MAG: response regulator transcription factor [Candidatus Omnitrophica bacterium]|nr:response regulator transcription factor [Candidatus Omnitrophota bacterium]
MAYSIFIVDDHDIIREGLKTILRRQSDYEVIGEAKDGEEALEKVNSLKPDILLLDITMPKKTGLEIIEQVLKKSPSTKILIISVHKANAYVLKALQSGVKGYLSKENAADDLLQALRKIVSGQVYLDAQASDYLLKKVSKPQEEMAAQSLLTDRETDVLRLVAEGKAAKEIAALLSLSPRTVENYKNNMLRKLGLHRTSDLIKYAIKNKIIDIEDF